MPIVGSNVLAGASGASGTFYDFEVQNSLLFNGSGGLRISSGEANTSYWTLSVWIKRHKLGVAYSTIMSATNYGGWYSTDVIGFGSANTMYSIRGSNANSFADNAGTALVRDTTAWYHYCLRNNNGTVTRWLNGVQDSTYSVSGTFVGIGRSGNHDIGAYGGSSEVYINNFSLAEFYFINDSGFDSDDVYDYTQFAEFKNGVLVPKENTLTAAQIGDGGWYYEFKQTGDNADASGVGADSSGNNHHASIIGTVSAHCRATIDTPINNFATLNPLFATGVTNTFSEGNLKVATSFSGRPSIPSTFVMPTGTGKWFFEARVSGYGGGVGIMRTDAPYNNDYYYGDYQWSVYEHSVIHNGASVGSLTGSATYPEVYGLMLDTDTDTLKVYVGGSEVGSFSVDAGYDYYAISGDGSGAVSITSQFNFGQDGTFQGNETSGGNQDAKGIGDFMFAVPTNCLALCTSNMAEPAIGPNSSTQADDYFNTVLYTGTGNATQNITGVGFQPDWVWIKNRNTAVSHYILDSSRGLKDLHSDSTGAEGDSTNRFNSFDVDGFQVEHSGGGNGFTNGSSQTYVAWNWKANGGTTSSNTDGTITSTVQANTTAGFSIVLYTGSESNATVGHGLGGVPDWLIWKKRNGVNDWVVYHSANTSEPATDHLHLNNTNATGDAATFFQDTLPTSTVFSIGTDDDVNDAKNYVVYCFRSIEGYSKFGSYSGNGSADGTFVYTGFRPAWVMIKRSDSSVGGNWQIQDSSRTPFNWTCNALLADSAGAENTSELQSTYGRDYLSNGFKIRASHSSHNTNGGTYIYMAFAEAPFKYANAR